MSAGKGTPRDAGGPFSPLVAVLMAVVGVFAFSAAMILLAYGPDLKSGDNGRAHALSRSAVGFAGAVEALRLSGQPVVINRAALPAGRRSGLLIVTPTPSADRKAIEALTFGGPVLVILPKWLTAPDPRRPGWVRKRGVLDAPPGSLAAQVVTRHRPGVGRPRLRGLAAPFAPGADLPAGPIDSLQTVTAAGWLPILTDETGAVVLARAPDRPLFLLSDPDLLDTQGIRDADTLAVGLAILRGLRAGDGAFIFDVRLNGLGRERTVTRLLFDPPFLAVTLCLAMAAALAGFQAFQRFGPVRPGGRVIVLGRAALVDNTAALIHLAGREHRMGGRYADLTADLTARAVGAPRGLGGDALTAFLDRLSARKRLAEPLSELAIQARMAQTPERMVEAARRLFAWRLAMTGPDRDPDGAARHSTESPPGGSVSPTLQPDGNAP